MGDWWSNIRPQRGAETRYKHQRDAWIQTIRSAGRHDEWQPSIGGMQSPWRHTSNTKQRRWMRSSFSQTCWCVCGSVNERQCHAASAPLHSGHSCRGRVAGRNSPSASCWVCSSIGTTWPGSAVQSLRRSCGDTEDARLKARRASRAAATLKWNWWRAAAEWKSAEIPEIFPPIQKLIRFLCSGMI